jgi:multidrug resistance efflux pump
MKLISSLAGRYALTLCLVAFTIVIALKVWGQYQQKPWTRDGRVRMDVIRVSTDVGGLVTQVLVHDNESVQPGQVLVVLDRPRIAASIERADAAVAEAQARLAQARKEAKRSSGHGGLIPADLAEQSNAKIHIAEAALKHALADRTVANLDMARTEIRASVRGVITNLDIHPGDYLAPGTQALALLDSASLHVEGYFEETKLHQIEIGDRARVRLMGEDAVITGYVDSIAAGIADDQRNNTGNLLPRVAPSFSWVSLAQRIPVRIRLDRVPEGLKVVAGRTAAVEIIPKNAGSVAIAMRAQLEEDRCGKFSELRRWCDVFAPYNRPM